LNITAASSFETLDNIYQITQRHIPEDRNLDIHRRENFKSLRIIAFPLYPAQLLISEIASRLLLGNAHVSLPSRHVGTSVMLDALS
jgi:hypothetical protein